MKTKELLNKRLQIEKSESRLVAFVTVAVIVSVF